MVQGPLGQIQASSFEGTFDAQDSSLDALQEPAAPRNRDPAVSDKEQKHVVDLAAVSSPSHTAATSPTVAEAGHDTAGGTAADTNISQASNTQLDRPAKFDTASPEGRRPQQVDLVDDLGVGGIGLEHAGDKENPVTDFDTGMAVDTGLGHGAGGFVSGGMAWPQSPSGQQRSRFDSLDALLGSAGNVGAGMGGATDAPPTQMTETRGAGGGAGGSDLQSDDSSTGHQLGQSQAVDEAANDVQTNEQQPSSQGNSDSSSLAAGWEAAAGDLQPGLNNAGPQPEHGHDANSVGASKQVQGVSAGSSGAWWEAAAGDSSAGQLEHSHAEGPAANNVGGDKQPQGSSAANNAAGWAAAAAGLAVDHQLSPGSEQLFPALMTGGKD
jgi:hypothetical protein